MWKKLIIIFLLVVWLSDDGHARSLSRKQQRKNIGLMPFYGSTSFDYTNYVESKRTSSAWQLRRIHVPTTQRPFVKYWNNLMRNVRLSIPTITWNITNPFTNIFSAGDPNFIETPVSQQQEEYSENNADYDQSLYVDESDNASSSGSKPKRKGQRKHRHGAKRGDKHQHSRRKPQHNVDNVYYDEGEFVVEASPRPQQYLLHSNEMHKPVYFYDPHTNEYYEIQSVRAQATTLNNHLKAPVHSQAVVEEDVGAEVMDDSEPEALPSRIEIPVPVAAPQRQHELAEIVGTHASVDAYGEEAKILLRPVEIDVESPVVAADEILLAADVNPLGAHDLQNISKVNTSARTRNGIIAPTTKANEGNSQTWKTFFYYFIP